MKAVLLFSLSIIVLGVKAWPPVKNPFELIAPQHKIHTISDCMHVTSEEGDFIYKKSPHLIPLGFEKESNMLEAPNPMTVCGLYVVAEPDHIVEITLKHFDINCESGGLMAFVDGWELNGEYFPGEHDHHKPLDQRVSEFCNDYSHWPVMSFKKFFRSSQNAALLQYRIPVRGSFIANVHFRKITEPCNIMVQDTLSVYNLSNHGRRGNCTLTALFPAVISLLKVHVGVRNQQGEHVSYECNAEDRVEIGGSSGLDSHAMEKSSDVCGYTETQGPEQAIFCGVTSARLISSGKHHNEAAILIRQADENDLEIATLVCPL